MKRDLSLPRRSYLRDSRAQTTTCLPRSRATIKTTANTGIYVGARASSGSPFISPTSVLYAVVVHTSSVFFITFSLFCIISAKEISFPVRYL